MQPLAYEYPRWDVPIWGDMGRRGSNLCIEWAEMLKQGKDSLKKHSEATVLTLAKEGQPENQEPII